MFAASFVCFVLAIGHWAFCNFDVFLPGPFLGTFGLQICQKCAFSESRTILTYVFRGGCLENEVNRLDSRFQD